MKNLFFLSFLLASFFSSIAQPIDEERMERDLEVAEQVLITLLNKVRTSAYFMQGFLNESISSSYIEDYGVVFTVDANLYSYGQKGSIALFNNKDDDVKIQDKVVIASSDYKDNKDVGAEHFIKEAKAFLVDYGNLIGQLTENQRIMVKWSNEPGPFFFVNNQVQVASGSFAFNFSAESRLVTAEISVADIRSYQSGNQNRENTLNKVVIEKNDSESEKSADLELLASMFQRLYQQDLSDTYYTGSRVSYQRIKGLGAIFKMKMYSSIENNGLFDMPTLDIKVASIKERNEKVMSLLPKFRESFKESLVSYGRTVKSLKDDELLIFEVTMTQCSDCPGFPEKLTFSIKSDALAAYNSGQSSFESVVSKVIVEKK